MPYQLHTPQPKAPDPLDDFEELAFEELKELALEEIDELDFDELSELDFSELEIADELEERELAEEFALNASAAIELSDNAESTKRTSSKRPANNGSTAN